MPEVFAPWDDPDANPLIRFQSVSKRFGSFTAIDEISLDIYPKEFFALLGPSGCGKTTLMRMLAGFETPSAGAILLDGEDLARVPPNARSTNMMFQSYALFPHLSVWENIAFGLKREGQPRDRIAARVEEMLRLVQLQGLARRKPHSLSGGQRQRVALARALAKAPKLLLLDEPLGALDKKLRQETQFELMEIQEATGTTFVIVTHDQEEAMTVASRIAVMDQGRIRQVAAPSQIYEAPNSRYVAGFIGEVTLLEGVAAARASAPPPEASPQPDPQLDPPPKPVPGPEDAPAAPLLPERLPRPNAMGRWLHDKVLSPVLGPRREPPRALPPPRPAAPEEARPEPAPVPGPEIPPGGIEIAWAEEQPGLIATQADPALAGQQVALALRPEKVAISQDRPLAANALQGKVLDIAYLGNISTYHVALDGGGVIKAQVANTTRRGAREITWEDRVWVSFAADAGVVLAQ